MAASAVAVAVAAVVAVAVLADGAPMRRKPGWSSWSSCNDKIICSWHKVNVTVSIDQVDE